MHYSVYPISMTLLNQKLENCNSVQDISENFKFIVTGDTPLVLSVFINSIEYLIRSFDDLNFQNWNFFLKKIAVIFPDDQKNSELERFKASIPSRMRELFPHLTKASKEKNDQQDSVDSALKQVSEVFLDGIKERIEYVFKLENAITAEKKAGILQVGLNLLILEADLIKHTSEYLETCLTLDAIQRECRLGCDRILRITGHREVTLYEIPSHLEETEEFSFWLQLSPYIDLSFDGDRLFASLKHISRSDIDLVCFRKFLLKIRDNASSEKIHFIIDKWLKNFEYENCAISTVKKVQALSKFIREISFSSLVQRQYDRNTEFEITPISFYLLKLLNDVIFKAIVEIPRDAPIDDLNNIKRVLDIWEIHKETQRKFFDEANLQLWTLIKTNTKKLCQYNQDLTSPANAISEKIRPYPKMLKILEQNENTNHLTNKKPLISKKSTTKPTSTSKKKDKQFSVKIVLKHDKNANNSNENVEIKENLSSTQSTVTEKSSKDESRYIFSCKDEPITNSAIKEVLPGEIFPFKFDQRVQRWNDHPFGEPFAEKEFPEYYDKSLVYQMLMHIFHAPHHLVDRFLSLGIEGNWLNVKNSKNNLRYVIPAEITYETVRYRGLIVYAIDRETNVCYHRYFTEKLDRDILYQTVNKVFNENDYPDLRDAVSVSQFPAPKLNVVDSSSICIKAGHVEIIDFDRNVKIKLFNVKNV